jgi:hypothetical protein
MSECTCDRDTLADGMATPGCPTHAPPTCGACGHPLSSHDINPHNGEPFCEEYGCPCQAAFVREKPSSATFESALTLSDCCMRPATRHCRAGADDVFVCRCGKVTTPVPAL